MIRSTRPELLAAGLFATIGGIAIVAVRGLERGTMMRMGPGYLPTAVAILILLLAAVLAARAMLARPAAADPVIWNLGPIIAILAALGVFALLIDPIGLVGATMALIVASRFADRPLRLAETIVLVLSGAVFSALVFVELLQLPIALWPA